MARAQHVEQRGLEVARRGAGVLQTEGLHHGRGQPEGLEELQLARQQGDELGGQRRLEHLARVGLEGERGGGGTMAPGLGEEGLMAQVHAIEVAQRERTTRQLPRLRHTVEDLHGRPV
jgi:hypothetical protein